MEERVLPRRQEPQHPATADHALSSGDDESTDSGEFEFPCFAGGDHASPALADDLFADGRIRPAAFYPVFGRRSSVAVAAPEAPAPERTRTRGQLGRLFLEESRAWNSSSSSSSSTGSSASTSTSSSSAAADDLEGAAPESYCLWAPGASSSPRPRKSGSTGSMARWRRISDLVVGRSHSDGKEKFLFLPANPPAPPSKQGAKNPATKPNTGAAARKKTEIGTVAAAHRAAQYGAAKAAGAGAPRRTFLPYREELVGFFANVHGISRSHPHPY